MAAGMARTRSFTGQLMFDPPNEGDVGSNATFPHRRYRSTPATFSALAIRFTREVVTPRNRATTAPEYPNRFTATWQRLFRARTACRSDPAADPRGLYPCRGLLWALRLRHTRPKVAFEPTSPSDGPCALGALAVNLNPA